MSSSLHLILKEKASVFSDPGLLELLHQHSVTEIEIIGTDGCCCVASSAVDACKSGFHVTLPCEFIGVRNMAKFEEKKETGGRWNYHSLMKQVERSRAPFHLFSFHEQSTL